MVRLIIDLIVQRRDQRGWKRRSGKKRLNSIRMPAVIENQIAENTGAVVRNFFMGRGSEGKSTLANKACGPFYADARRP